MKDKKISLWLAIIININVIIGAGAFINPASITKLAGSLGCLSYLGVALLMLPLVMAIAKLASLYPDNYGGLYVYNKQNMGTTIGLVSGISYFLGKAFSCAVLSRTFAVYCCKIFPAKPFCLPLISIFTLFLLGIFNAFGVKTSSRVQLGFIVFKLLPIILVITTAYLVFDFNIIKDTPYAFEGFLSSLPVAMYGLLGFESCCAIGKTLVHPEKNLSRAVLGSFLIAASIFTLFQSSLFGSLGDILANSLTPLADYATKLGTVYADLAMILKPFFHSAIMISVLGACYGILFFNGWHGYAVFSDVSTMTKKKLFTQLNSFGMPTSVIFLQLLLSSCFVVLPLETVSLARFAVFGVVVTYFLSGASLAMYYHRRAMHFSFSFIISILGLLSSGIVLLTCLKDLVK